MRVNYYPFHIGDYAKDTRHLSILEDGAYRRLLDLYYTNEGPLEHPVDKLCELVGAKTAPERRAVEKVLSTLFVICADGSFKHRRCEREISKAKEKSSKASTSSRKRWQSERNANAMPTHTEGNAIQEPIPNTNKHQWWKTEDGIREKGTELGMAARPGESWADYKRRIFDRIHGAEKAA